MTDSALASTRLDELESVIERGLGTFVEVGTALREIRDERLYRLRDGYTTFEAYCQERWGFNDRRASQMIAAAEVSTIVGTSGSPTTWAIPSEAVARELAPLKDDPSKLREAWQKIHEEHAGEKITAKVVRQGVRQTRCDTADYAPCDPAMPANTSRENTTAARVDATTDRVKNEYLRDIMTVVGFVQFAINASPAEEVARYVGPQHDLDNIDAALHWLGNFRRSLRIV